VTEAATTSPAKLDPERLALRARPPRAIRFRRSVLIAIAAVGSIGLVTVTWLALKPRLFHGAFGQEELSQPDQHPTSDTLNGLPANYGDVPRLGPPLPGDLGKPILDRQQQLAADVNASDPQRQRAEAAESERQLTEMKAARESGLLVQNRQAAPAPEATMAGVPAADGAQPSPSKLALDPVADPNAQGRKEAFVGSLDPRDDVNPHTLTPPPSPYTLSAGSVISASLITGLRSDLPGLVTAQVTENTYDSATGRILLIPQGARLIGSYDSVVAFGQSRALIVWQRIVMPDGSALRVDNVPATDPSGYGGLQDKVDYHTWSLLKGVAISTMVSVGANLTFTGESDLVQAIRESTQQNVSRAGDQITSRNLQIQPTITIRPGAPVRLVVHRDLILAPWKP
jgi:type IV secretion system protein VirB10